MKFERFIPLLYILLFSCNANIFFINTSQSFSYVEEAEIEIISVYYDLLAAENEGLIVVDLLPKVHNAVDLLVESKIYFNLEDHEEGLKKALKCIEISGEVKEEINLRIFEFNKNIPIQDSLMYRIILLFTLLVLVTGWVLIKRYYFKKYLDLKPMVS